MVFIVDDNFIGDKKRTKELLREMIAWRERVRPGMGFLTEASVNLADDAELCELMGRAGFKKVFVGIETPSVESLQECHKLQNKGRDLVAAVQTLQRAGMEVMGGFIVGFDSDQQDIFKRQFDFIQRSGVVTAMVGLLQALPQTRLYQRLVREGRIESVATGNNTQAVLNFKTEVEPGIPAERLSRFDETPLRAQGLLSADPHVPEKPSGARSGCAAGSVRFEGFLQIVLAPGRLGSRAPPLLAIHRQHPAQPPSPIPPRHGVGHHRLPLPPRCSAALTVSLRLFRHTDSLRHDDALVRS